MARRKIRICYVLNSFEIGGAETVALDLARMHDPKIYEVEVLAALEPNRAQESEMRRRFSEAGVKTTVICQKNFRSPLALWRLFAHLKRGKFDIVHGHNRGSDYWAAKLGLIAGARRVFWTRHLVYRDMTRKQIKRYSQMSAKAEKVIAVSDAVKQSCIETEKNDADKVTTIVNGIDTKKYRPLADEEKQLVRNQLKLKDGELLLLFVGRFSDQKAPETFPRLIWKLRDMGLPVRGAMCGHGPLAVPLQDQVNAGPSGVEILGLRSDVPQLLGAADLFVSTSRNEGLPLNVMEAMSTGTPFVAPRIPQIEELVSGESGANNFLYSAPPLTGEIDEKLIIEWSNCVGNAMDNGDLLDEWGRRGRTIIKERFGLELMVERYERQFERSLEELLR